MDVATDSLTGFAQSLQEKGKQPATVDSYCRDARDFLEFLESQGLPLNQVEPDTLLHYQDYLAGQAHDKHNSIRRKVIGTRQFFRYLSESRQLVATPFDEVPIPERFESLPESMDPKALDAFLDPQQDDDVSLKGLRDRAIICLLALEGLKANELIHLQWQDYLPRSDGATLRINGLRLRTIELSHATQLSLKLYRAKFQQMRELWTRSATVNHRMFISFKGRNGAVILPQLTRHGLKFLLYEIGEQIHVNHLNSELLRHHAVQFQLALGKSAEDVMGHMGLRRPGNIAKHASNVGKKPTHALS